MEHHSVAIFIYLRLNNKVFLIETSFHLPILRLWRKILLSKNSCSFTPQKYVENHFFVKIFSVQRNYGVENTLNRCINVFSRAPKPKYIHRFMNSLKSNPSLKNVTRVSQIRDESPQMIPP